MIEYPKKHSEAEIAALLWYFLRKKKLDARLQVRSPSQGKKHAQLDLVIFDKNKEAICIVECKSWNARYSVLERYMRSKNSKQIKKYEVAFNLPVFVIGRMAQINSIQDEIIKLIQNRGNH